MKNKVLSVALIGSLLIPACLGLAGCGNKTTPHAKSLSTKEVYAMSAISGASYFNSEVNPNTYRINNNLQANFLAETTAATERPTDIADSIDGLNNYIKMFEGYIVDGKTNVTSSKPTESDGAYADYNIKISMEIPALDGTKSTYILYYNEVDTTTNREIEEDEEEVEVNTTLEGVVLSNGNVYPVEGSRTVETEGNETETEVEFKTYMDGTKTNFIHVKQEIENDEVEYIYQIKNGEINYKTKIEFEYDEDEIKMELAFINNSIVDNKLFKIEYLTLNGEPILKVNYKSGANASSFTIALTDAGYVYNYANGFSEVLAR